MSTGATKRKHSISVAVQSKVTEAAISVKEMGELKRWETALLQITEGTKTKTNVIILGDSIIKRF